ncbi:MAG: alanine racemase [Candidatus Pacearchaeota archaeon]
MKNNFLINIDSKSELDKISKILKGKPFKVGIRITTKDSKFGIQADKINEIINYAKSKNLKVICLHFHQGTQIGINYYEENLQKFSDLIRNLNIPLEYIDLGGGFPDKPRLKDLGLKLENYFEVIKKYFYDFDKTIILEPGRALVSDCFELLTCVKVIKENFGKNYAILDAGINLLPKITLSKYKFTKLQDGECKEVEKKKEYILAGPLLFSNDILGKFYGILKEGDIIKVENVGAYCYNLAWEISYKKPKIILF